jgi:Mlc titration factor MtfA (ptsG expression regulator)
MDTVLDPYGATNPAEFFAVATEAFFEKPQQLRDGHRALYDQLKQYYVQDPATYVDGYLDGSVDPVV